MHDIVINIANFVLFMVTVYFYMIIVYIFMSWIPGARESTIGLWLGRIVEPYLQIFSRIIPPLGMFDFSPIVALIVLQLFQRGLVSIINQFVLPLFY